MKKISKISDKRMNRERDLLIDGLDMSMPATAVAFREMAQAYTKKATKTKDTAIKTLYREKILTKRGKLTKIYS